MKQDIIIARLAEPLQLNSGQSLPRILPGPMEGLMHPVFCLASSRLKLLDIWMTPFLRISNAVPRHGKIRQFLEPFTDSGLPVILQLMGTCSDLLAETAVICQQFKLAGINLNFACPSRQVVRSNAGGWMLQRPKLMLKMVETIKFACPELSLSVKLRSGFADWREMNNFIPELVQSGTLDFIAVHFRTVEEAYLPVEGGWERMACAVQLAGNIPVIASGDIFSVDDALGMVRKSGCAGVMAARGLLKDPFIIRRIQSAASGETLQDDLEYNRSLFFNTLLQVARENPERYWSRQKFVEFANFIWGRNHPVFEKIKTLSNDELFQFQI